MKNTLLYLICAIIFLPAILLMLPILLPLAVLMLWIAVLLGSQDIIAALGTWIIDPTQETWVKRYKLLWLFPLALIISYFFSGSNALKYMALTFIFGTLTALTGHIKRYW